MNVETLHNRLAVTLQTDCRANVVLFTPTGTYELGDVIVAPPGTVMLRASGTAVAGIEQDRLRAALKGVAPMIGWLGQREGDMTDDLDTSKLRCEYCDGTDTASPETVQHAAGCPVPPLLASLSQHDEEVER